MDIRYLYRLILFFNILVSIFVNYIYAKAPDNYKGTMVSLHLKSSFQADTFGVNLNEHLPPLIYNQIMNNEATLWDSPNKKVKLTKEILTRIENDSKTSFSFCENIFIFEKWTSAKSIMVVELVGFYFSGKDRSGKEVSYGFVPFSDIIEIMKSSRIPANANGFYNFTFWEVLAHRRFDYNIINIDNVVISNNLQSDKIKKEAFKGKELILNNYPVYPVEQIKKIKYVIEKNNDSSNVNSVSSMIFANIEKFLTDNQEIFLNIGGSEIISHLDSKISVHLDRIVIEEIWTNEKNKKIGYKPLNLCLHVNMGYQLQPVTFTDLSQWGLKINEVPADDFFIQKKFNYFIVQINSQDVKISESEKYLKALNEYHWSGLSEYVRYY